MPHGSILQRIGCGAQAYLHVGAVDVPRNCAPPRRFVNDR
jgi:hypothetical protein